MLGSGLRFCLVNGFESFLNFIIYLFIYLFIYLNGNLFLRERERVHEQGKGRERGGQTV